MLDFELFIRAAGLLPRTVAADGRWRRCPTEDHPRTRNGAYKLAVDGLVGWVQNHAIHDEVLTWRPDTTEVAPMPVDYHRIRRRNAAERARRTEAIAGARAFYATCDPLRYGHPYLSAKGLGMEGCRGLKQDRDGWLVVPMLVGEAVQSVQRIAVDGAKLFWSGAPVTAASYRIERARATLTVLAEGLATGLALFAAVPQARVVVAFNSGNLAAVARQIPRTGLVVVAADNDHATEARIGTNPGREAAVEAAAVLGCGTAAPEEIAGSDWADYRQERIERGGSPVYGRRTPSATDVRRTVDAEIARALMRHARFAPLSRS